MGTGQSLPVYLELPAEPPVCLGCLPFLHRPVDTGYCWLRVRNDNDKWVRGSAFSMPELPAEPPVCLGCLPFLQRPVDTGYCWLRVRNDNDKWITTVVRTWTHQTGAFDARYGAVPPVCLGCPAEPSSMPGAVVLSPQDRSRLVPGRIGLVSC